MQQQQPPDAGAAEPRIAVVAGATGVAGSEIINELLKPHNRGLYSKIVVLSRKAKGRPEDLKALLYREVTPEEGALLHCAKADLLHAEAPAELARIIESSYCPPEGRPRKIQLFYTAMYAKGQMKLPFLAATRWSTKLMHDFSGSINRSLNALPNSTKDSFYDVMAQLSGAAYSDENLRMLTSCISGCERAGQILHVSLLTGGKMYGMQYPEALCPDSRPPYVEDVSRGPPPNFYMAQEALVLNSGYAHTIVRPSFILGVPPPGSWNASSMSIGLALGTYCAMLYNSGSTVLPFPGSTSSCDVRMQMSATPDIAHILIAGANKRRLSNQAFNVVSCQSFTWREVWPSIASFWGMKPELPEPNAAYSAGKAGLSILASHIGSRDLGEEWKKMSEEQNLLSLEWKKVFNDDFFDKTFSVDWDTEFSTLKLEQFDLPRGESHTAADLLCTFFMELIKMKVIPEPPGASNFIVNKTITPRTTAVETEVSTIKKVNDRVAVQSFTLQQGILMLFGVLFFCGFANNLLPHEVALLAFSGYLLHVAYEALLLEEQR